MRLLPCGFSPACLCWPCCARVRRALRFSRTRRTASQALTICRYLTASSPGPRNPDPLMPTPPPAFPQAGSGMGPNNGNSVLAGTVVDAYHRPMGNAYVRWVNLVDKDAGAPIDVAADANGHFIIQGVKPGASYKLIARTKQGEKMLAGTVLTNAPNVRVLIPIREDLVT